MRRVALVLFLALVSAAARASEWSDLWTTHEQQAQQLLDSKRPAEAAPLFADPRRRAYAELQAGQYAKAAEHLAPFKDADSQYNRGNALAHTGKLKDALAAYDSALRQSPGNRDVIRNRDLVAQALKQRSQAGQQQNGGSSRSGSQGKGQSQSKNGHSGQGANDSGARSPDAKNQDAKSQGGQKQDNGAQSNSNGQSAGQPQQGKPSQAGGATQPNGDGKSANQGQQSGQGQHGNPSQAGTEPQPAKQAQAGNQSQSGNQAQASNQAQTGSQAQSATPQSGRAQQASPPAAPGNTSAGAAGEATAQSQAQRPNGADATSPTRSLAEAGQRGDSSVDALSANQALSGAAPVPQQPRSEQALSLDQWLRGIPEDSGELLRRKFLIEHMMKQQGNEQ